MSKKIKIMIIEDNKLIRIGLKTIIEESNDFELICEANNGGNALYMLKRYTPEVILLDLGLPDISGLALIEKILKINNEFKILILSCSENYDEILKALSLGVFGYIFKDISTDLLINVIKSISNGAMWLDSRIVPYIRENNNDKIIPAKKLSRSDFRATHSDLTQREYEVLKLIVEGKSNHDIAEILCISEHTAKAHVCNIIQKLVVDDRTQAAVKALKEGMIWLFIKVTKY